MQKPERIPFEGPISRGDQGILLGVCQGLADRFHIDVLLVRIAYLVSVFFFGVSIFLYFLVALCVPKKSQMYSAFEPKILGVCLRFGRRFDLDPSVVRLFFVLLLFATGGAVLLGYLILHFILPTIEEMDRVE